MVDPKTILSDIEQNVIARLKEKGLDLVKAYEIKKEGDAAYSTPAVRAVIADGKFKRVGQTGLQCDVTLYVIIIFKNVSDELSRRKGVYPILMGAVNLLFGQTLGLSIEELEPLSFREITSALDDEKGLIVFQLPFTTNFGFTMLEDEAAKDLLSLGLSYYLKPGDETEDATDEVTIAPA